MVPVSDPVWVADWDLSEQADPNGLLLLQHAVGGYIEVIYGRDWHAYINEDGRALRLGPNSRATLLAYEFYGVSTAVLLGTVVFLGSGRDSDEHDCPPDLIVRARELPI